MAKDTGKTSLPYALWSYKIIKKETDAYGFRPDIIFLGRNGLKKRTYYK